MRIRSRHLVVIDMLLITLAFYLSLALRLDSSETVPYALHHSPMLPFIVATKVAVFVGAGLYRRVWRYASVPEAVSIVAAATASALIMGTAVLFLSGPPLQVEFVRGFPRSVVGIDCLLTLVLVGLSRFGLRVWEESRIPGAANGLKHRRPSERHVLIAGAGDAGAMIARELRQNPGLGIEPVGFVDDDGGKCGLQLVGLRVLGRCDDIPVIVGARRVNEVIIAMPSAPGMAIRRIIEICREANVRCRTVPGVYELIDGRVSVREARQISIEDLLRRAPVDFDDGLARETFAGRVILVTGGGGSIGFELCRQLASLGPARLVVLGHGENSVFESTNALRRLFPALPIEPVVASVCDRARVRSVLQRHAPHVVFHAAAHKHVPLMEANPAEAVRNNVIGTRIVAEEAALAGIERFVLISTDKAVDPVNVMGATKHAAELIVRAQAGRSRTIFASVRFGNVLGSRGSLVPILRQQIAAGGPITITDPAATRYFMTIPEAAKLVIHAGALASGGEVFILQMGQPLEIQNLVLDMVRLSGLEPGRDIDVVVTGLRPGERLHERLVEDWEHLHETSVPNVLVAQSAPVDPDRLTAWIDVLEEDIEQGDEAVLARLAELAAHRPAATPNGHPPTSLEEVAAR